MRTRRLAATLGAAGRATTAAATARALTTRDTGSVVPVGTTASFATAGWTCSNYGAFLTCRHGADMPYVDLASRHGRNFIVTVYPAPGPVGAPQPAIETGRPGLVYIFSSAPRSPPVQPYAAALPAAGGLPRFGGRDRPSMERIPGRSKAAAVAADPIRAAPTSVARTPKIAATGAVSA